MTQLCSKKMLALLMALCLLAMAGCNRSGGISGSSSSEEPSVSGPSSQSGPVTIEEDENLLDPIFLVEEIEKGQERNPDTIGWLRLPNTTIDDAVLQRVDSKATHQQNNDYYLRIDEDKNYSIFGCYFVDADCLMGNASNLSRNTIIYGHSDLKDNKDGKKFSQLFKYTDIEFVRNNRYIYFSTYEEDMVWEVFAVFYTNWKDFNYIQANPSDEQFEYIINEAKARSQYIIDTTITNRDNILTLSTCSAYYNTSNPDDYRFVVMARQMPSNRVPDEPLKVEKNPSPKKS